MRRSVHHINIEKVVREKIAGQSKLRNLVKWILNSEQQKRAWAINIVLVDDDYMTQLNQSFFSKSTPTDVISFNLSDDRSECCEGEIYINTDSAKSQAEEYRVSLENEILRLAAHGTYHLLGYDDGVESARLQMSRLEDQALSVILGNK